MKLLLGKARLEVAPFCWLDPRWGAPEDQAAAVMRALWYAHPSITSVTIRHEWPAIAVDVAIPADGSLELTALQADLAKRVLAALTG